MNQTQTLFSMTRRALSALVLLAVAGLFVGASCETKETKPDVIPKATPDAGPGEKADTKKPQNIGPDAPAIFMMSGLKGYTEPCGCTLDIMLGGIDRVVRYLDDAKKLYPAHTLVDGGNLFFEMTELSDHEIPQEKARVDVIVQGLKRMQVIATVPGNRDFVLGTEFYLSKIRQAGITPLGVNITIDGEPLETTKTVTLDGQMVTFIGVADPAQYKDIKGVVVTDPKPALVKALATVDPTATVILLAHGELGFVKAQLEEHPRASFGLVGLIERETDQVDAVAGRAFTLEPYDQGRYVGILKLFRRNDGAFVNARLGSKSEVDAVEKQIEHVNTQINRIPPVEPGKEPPAMLVSLRKRLDGLRVRRTELMNGGIEVPEGKNTFIWRSVPLEPEFAGDAEIEKIRDAYNRDLKKLNSTIEREIVPVPAGEAFYIGSNQCGMCHTSAMEFWKTTAHGDALATLVERNKDFDQSCIGCHVVGYEKPGGSVLGKLEYSVEYQPTKDTPAMTIEKDLRNVGCENCHGPGSAHRFAPVGDDGKPQHILTGSGVSTCTQCHVPEHSPRFNYETYVRQITGEGHTLRTK